MGLAFGAGLVAALNPCGFAMLPAYLTLVVRGEETSQLTALGRALAATAAMAIGFITVFGAFGLLTVSAASTVQRYLPFVTVLIGIALVALGIWLLSGRELTVLIPNPMARSRRWAPSARLGSMFGYGVSYAIASLSCTIGPFLAVTGASLQSDSVLDGLFVYVAYAAGLTLGYYGFYEVRLFTANGDPRDPVIAAAGRIQGALAGWVHQHGAWPWIAALAVLVLGAVAWTRRRNASSAARPHPSDRATAGDEP